MARAARRDAGAAPEALPGVKLFAASSGWPYKPNHAPRDAVILFHGGPQERPSYVGKAGHVGHRYAPLICALARPEHDNVFIVDLSQVAPVSEWKAEVQRPGRVMKMLEKWFAKFNPCECTAVVCGDDISLLLVAAQVAPGAKDRRFSSAVIVDPQASHKKMLERLSGSMDVASAQPNLSDIVAKANRVRVGGTESGEQPKLAIGDLHFVSVEFSLHPQSKQLVQKASNVTAAALMVPTAAVDVPADVVAKAPAAKSGGSVVEGVMTHHLSLGMSFRGLVVQVQGMMSEGVTARVALGDCVGTIEALVPKADQAAMVRGRIVSVAGRVACVQGRQFVVVDRVEGVGDFREGYNPVRMGLRNASERVRRYGVLILRGGQCVLSRRGGVMRIPMREATTQETPEQAATRSAAEVCDIYPEEFALLRDVAPAVVYDPPESGPSPAVTTIFAAVATNPPPPGHDEEESEDEDDDYDWFLYDRAVKRLQTAQERKACAVLAQNVKDAVSASIFVPDLPCTFGPKVLPADAQLALADPAAALAPESSPEPRELLPVTVLSGFLGAGKTTLLKHILENVDGLKVAVIVNDMAEVNIDAQLVSSASSMQHQSEKVVEMTNGCICCTLREDLLTGIVELSDQKKFDYVVIESSGISEPLPVAETFTFDHKDSARLLKDVARLDTMVTVVDGVNVLANMQSSETTATAGQSAYEGDVRAMAQLLVDQIEFANVILLNKCDLLSDVAKAEVRSMLRKLNPEAVVIETTNSVISPKQVLNTRLFSMDGAEKHEMWLKEARIGEHKPETEEFGIRSFVYRRRRAFHPGRLRDLMWTPGALPTEVMRAKGYLWVASRPDFVAVLSLVGTQRDMTQGQPWWAAVDHDLWPEGLWEDIKPLWNEKSGDRAQEIVVIGRHDRAEIEKLLDACLLNEEEALLDPKEFVDELPKWEEHHDHDHAHAEVDQPAAAPDQPAVAPVDVH